MIQTNQIVPIVKELVYHIHTDEMDDILKLRAVIKLQRIVLDSMADLLEAKSVQENIYLSHELFKFYAVIAKAYNFLFDTLKIAEVTNDEKAAILEMIGNMEDIEDSNEVINLINSLQQYSVIQSTETFEEMIASVEPELKNIYSKTEATEEAPVGGESTNLSLVEDVQVEQAPVEETKVVEETAGKQEATEPVEEKSSVDKGTKTAKKSRGTSNKKGLTKK